MKKPGKTGNGGAGRREFLLLSRQLFLSASALAFCPLTLRANDIDGLKLQYLDTHTGLLLARVSRLLFPHKSLADTVYLQVVAGIETDMAGNAATRAQVQQLPAILSTKAGGDWLQAGVKQQLAALRAIEKSPVFHYLRTRTLESLYRNPVVWKLIGYQGSSIEFGGYLHRGFDDIDWLE